MLTSAVTFLGAAVVSIALSSGYGLPNFTTTEWAADITLHFVGMTGVGGLLLWFQSNVTEPLTVLSLRDLQLLGFDLRRGTWQNLPIPGRVLYALALIALTTASTGLVSVTVFTIF